MQPAAAPPKAVTTAGSKGHWLAHHTEGLVHLVGLDAAHGAQVVAGCTVGRAARANWHRGDPSVHLQHAGGRARAQAQDAWEPAVKSGAL